MSSAAFRIAFDGEALASHTMDVRDLAPSLLGLGEIFVEANRLLNGKDVKLEIHVTPNIEEHCFDIGLEILQSWEAIKKLLGSDDVTAAKELIDWLLLNKVIATVGVGSLLLLYQKIKGKKPVSIITFKDDNGNPLYRYQFDGEDDQILDEKLHKLYESNKIRSQLGRLLRPIVQRPGVDEFTVYEQGEKAQGSTITKSEAQEIDFTAQDPEEVELPEIGKPIEAILRVYSPVYDSSAPRWRFWFGNEHYYMDVSESNIRKVVLDNGGALMDDRFKVLLQRTESVNEEGETVQDFKVLEVLDFNPAYRQSDLFLSKQNADNTEESDQAEED